MIKLLQEIRTKGKLGQAGMSSLDSIFRKKIGIEDELSLILGLCQKIIDNVPNHNPDDEIILITKLANYADQIYSIMEYVSQVVRSRYNDLYNLPSGFNDLQKWVEKPTNNCDEALKFLICSSKHWYNLAHAIRTEEEHFQMGSINFEYTLNGVVKLKYQNRRRSPRGQIYVTTNGFVFDIESCNDLYIQINKFLEQLLLLLAD